MKLDSQNSAVLLLSDGTFFEGLSFGIKGTVFGEVVFNTGITGYQEVITDPSYFGQLVTFTYPEIGNTGINNEDNESENSSVKGVIVRQYAHSPSNWRSNFSIDDWFKKENIVGIYGIDTRALVRHLRSSGSMNGVISSDANISILELQSQLDRHRSMAGMNLVDEVSTKKEFFWNNLSSVEFDQRIKHKSYKPYKVVAIDFGIKKSILERLVAHNCEINVLPANSDINKVMSFNPEGIFFSNGPGDPASVHEGIALAKELIINQSIPLFGICLGHQILGIALGGKTFKLDYGHRGLNHPCGIKGRLEITSQNHGFALDKSSLDKRIVEITHLNLNDKTVAGISMLDKPVFGIQYHPEASPGPHDADHHFNRFVSLMEQRRKSVV
ncbi:glutamine-hydrolyzing carbamoyl-phosphate synthase small subunit [Prochlorococcus sp. MIT 1223]|uniref:glutamine-hydrolyzing carbamoyl-phosphate synthase small subunit n=1 Tax=Prochlorococcus sp. MIT 1223 TaxID=3096217 RepID=UPI002A754E47|nr:glutamine-hydrolyzing carbamoyl-phosphate synthase small subunit [Prochlorococcus sp. MIT 1223]